MKSNHQQSSGLDTNLIDMFNPGYLRCYQIDIGIVITFYMYKDVITQRLIDIEVIDVTYEAMYFWRPEIGL